MGILKCDYCAGFYFLQLRCYVNFIGISVGVTISDALMHHWAEDNFGASASRDFLGPSYITPCLVGILCFTQCAKVACGKNDQCARSGPSIKHFCKQYPAKHYGKW